MKKIYLGKIYGWYVVPSDRPMFLLRATTTKNPSKIKQNTTWNTKISVWGEQKAMDTTRTGNSTG